MHISSLSRPRWRILYLLFVLSIFAFTQSATAESHTDNKPTNQVSDLVCHTSDPAECYPRVFLPSNEFQVVRDDQELPRSVRVLRNGLEETTGLHVRMNINTGQKEAKIYNPDEDADESSQQYLPVAVDPDDDGPDVPQVPKGAPEYENVGKIKQPQHEQEFVYMTLETLRYHPLPQGPELDESLTRLEEVSHDMYYGLKIVEDHEAVQGLLCLFASPEEPAVPGQVSRDERAAQILSGALQNNPAALKEFSGAWADMTKSLACPGDGGSGSFSLWDSLVPVYENGASATKAKVSAVNGMIKDGSIRKAFLAQDGMSRLLRVFTMQGPGWANAQRKVGQLILDNFLDEDMGASLDEWPRMAKLSDATCQRNETSLEEGCWEYHVEQAMKQNKGTSGHWSRDLYDKLKAARKNLPQEQHQEL